MLTVSRCTPLSNWAFQGRVLPYEAPVTMRILPMI